MERLAYIPPLALYSVLAVVHLLPGVWKGAEGHARALAIGGAVTHALALGLVWGFGEYPSGFPEALSGASLGILAAYAWIGEGRMRSVGVALVPVALVLLGTSLFVPHRRMSALVEAGPSPLLPLHLALMFSGLAAFALSFGVGVAYLLVRSRLKQKDLRGIASLPPLEVLDRLQFRSTLFGFVFLTLGIGVGGVWAAASLSEPWVLDAKILFTLGLWAWYGVALQLRLVASLRGRWSALFSIVGFGGMIFSVLALNLLTGGWHGYGR